MVWTKRIDPKKWAIPIIVIVLAIAGVLLYVMGGDEFQAGERESLAGIYFALAAFLFSFAIVLWKDLTDLQNRMSKNILIYTVVVTAVLMLLGGVLAPALANLPDLDGNSLFLSAVATAAIAIPLAIFLLVAFKEALGESNIEKIKLSFTQTRKIWGQYRQNKSGMFALTVLVIIFGMAIFGPYVALENPNDVKHGGGGLPQPPDGTYWLGTDAQNKDILSQVLYGSGTSLLVGILAGAISLVLGTAIGLTAGYYGRATDELLMRLTDFFLVIPWFPLMIVLVAILGKSLMIVIIVIGVVSWSPTARVVRAAVLSIKEKQYIERSRALGGGTAHIIRRHIFPNVFPLIVATSILLVAEAIFSEAFLDFFGLGDPNVVSWGWMLERAHANGAMLNFWWWWILPPGIAIIMLIMSFYLVGDTLDEILNPRLKHR
jgi:peptide/nickel transport system permease protein